ncbi:CehA/McbA family metallohydrolase [Pontibacillus litoralis]|uniref:Polymerase/histidinol phosphatase N-terminal domain-containing protein n=1 Tax=Pontibacillus litoralis JSM 072002 TaxID=1385512 RepID=A0A0A5G3N3_9BACI|nr:CehA/McbA family metallohydrolase [Pontibacillus litoralis]KGX86644.1 hypothetical protein N784_04355 [Pontibacillus litoralis JSM 072002]
MTQLHEWKTTNLFETTMSLNKSADQSHVMFRFFVPNGMDNIEIEFSFDPVMEEHYENVKEMIEEHVKYYDPNLLNNENAIKKMMPLRNLLTISVDDPIGFRGSCHRWEPISKIVVQDEDSTPGMLNRETKSGMWNIIVNCHSIVTDECKVHVKIDGKHKESLTKRWYHQPLHAPQFPLKTHEAISDSAREEYVWTKSEIHTHTNHSDASQTINQLLEKAKQLDIQCVAVTDHNTMSAVEHVQRLEEQYGIRIIRGIEWTTFYGHLLTLGYDHVTAINWSKVGPISLEESIQEIKKEGAIAGIAHPFRPGSPFCTGCHWEYAMDNISQIDFIEVWNGENPHKDKYNMEAFQLWTDLLNKGHQLAATCGRDWHNQDTDKEIAFLYTNVPSTYSNKDFLHAIVQGHSFITLGPTIDFRLNDCYIPGDKVSIYDGEVLSFNVSIGNSIEDYTVIIDSNIGIIGKETLNHYEKVLDNSEDIIWVRACVYSFNKTLIAFTNPIYIMHK